MRTWRIFEGRRTMTPKKKRPVRFTIYFHDTFEHRFERLVIIESEGLTNLLIKPIIAIYPNLDLYYLQKAGAETIPESEINTLTKVRKEWHK